MKERIFLYVMRDNCNMPAEGPGLLHLQNKRNEEDKKKRKVRPIISRLLEV
jgi:hypothetical protein